MLAPTCLSLALVLGAALGPPTPIAPGRTNTVRVTPDVGAPLERAVPNRAFERAVAMDAEQRWSEAANLYQQASAAWTEAFAVRASPALQRAILKADRERQRSTLLASMSAPRGQIEPHRAPVSPLEEGRMLRAKLMLVRAAGGLAPPDLVARARRDFDDAARQTAVPRPGVAAEVHLQLCATRAAAGDRAGARLERASLTTAERQDLDNAYSLAICAAALDEDADALAHLEAYALRPTGRPPDPYTLRDVYLSNDWDRLRGGPRFESLFRAALATIPPPSP